MQGLGSSCQVPKEAEICYMSWQDEGQVQEAVAKVLLAAVPHLEGGLEVSAETVSILGGTDRHTDRQTDRVPFRGYS